jgi:hypothetical protein
LESLLDVWLNPTVLMQKKKGSDEDAEGLQNEILLAEGAKFMTTCNVWTSKGVSSLFNFSSSFSLIS